MSFPPRYGSSVSRDYVLLQGHPASYQHVGTLHDQLQPDHDHDHDHDHDRDRDADDQDITDDATLSSCSLSENPDGLSNISLPGSQLVVASGSPSFARPNRVASYQAISTSPLTQRPGANNAYPIVAGIPSEYLLGGSAVPPPVSAGHLSAADQNQIQGDEQGLAHQPTHVQAPTTKYTQLSSRAYPETQTSDANETSSLLSRVTGESGFSLAYGANPSERATLVDGHRHPQAMRKPSTPRLSIGAASITSGGGAGAISGWGVGAGNMLSQVPVPGVGQIDSIVNEPMENIAVREAKVLVRYTIPIWATHLLELSLSVAPVFSLGHLGTIQLAAASLSSMTANVSGYSVLSGFVTALDTILPSAYTQQPKSVGLWTQRMAVILAALIPMIWTIWFNAEAILIKFGQDPQVSKLAGQYLFVLSFGLPGYALFETCRRYLQAQGLMHAPTVVLILVSPLNAIANYLLVWGPDSIRIGFIGAPLASAVSMWLMAILCFLQCILAPRDAWDGWSRAAFKWDGLKSVLSLGFAGMISLAAEWWAWEVVGLVTSLLGTTSLAAQSVLLVSSSLTYQLPYGASVAAAVRVGNLLGANRPQEAKVSAKVSLILSLVTGGINSTMFLIFRKQWGWLFSSDAEVVSLVEGILPLLGLFQVADGICGIAGGVLRGTGRQAQGALLNMTAYYIVGIPIGLVLSFSKIQMGLAGLWWGLTIALLYGSVGMLILIIRTDWEWEVKKVQLRMTLDNPSEPIGNPIKSDMETNVARQTQSTAAIVAAIASGEPLPSASYHARSATSISSSIAEEEDVDPITSN